MALVFQRRLAIPLSAMAFFAVADGTADRHADPDAAHHSTRGRGRWDRRDRLPDAGFDSRTGTSRARVRSSHGIRRVRQSQ